LFIEIESKKIKLKKNFFLILILLRFIWQSKPMYNNCALIGGIICLADVFLLGADSQTANPARFVRLCQVRN
jgi:hypothetical protein